MLRVVFTTCVSLIPLIATAFGVWLIEPKSDFWKVNAFEILDTIYTVIAACLFAYYIGGRSHSLAKRREVAEALINAVGQHFHEVTLAFSEYRITPSIGTSNRVLSTLSVTRMNIRTLRNLMENSDSGIRVSPDLVERIAGQFAELRTAMTDNPFRTSAQYPTVTLNQIALLTESFHQTLIEIRMSVFQ